MKDQSAIENTTPKCNNNCHSTVGFNRITVMAPILEQLLGVFFLGVVSPSKNGVNNTIPSGLYSLSYCSHSYSSCDLNSTIHHSHRKEIHRTIDNNTRELIFL